jgi:uncharacterized protein YhhL (DUF1145 family)
VEGFDGLEDVEEDDFGQIETRRGICRCLDKRRLACVNYRMKQSVLVMWFVLLAGMIFGSGGLATAANFGFAAIAIVHVIEFLVKKSVLEKAGGSMGHHFLQTLIYGLFHWKPLEDQQSAAVSEGS